MVRSCIFADVKILMIDDIDDAEMRNDKLSITAAMIFDVWCCFQMNRQFCFNVFNYQKVYGSLQG